MTHLKPEQIKKALKDPAAVYVNMARGSIAKLNHRDLASFYTSAPHCCLDGKGLLTLPDLDALLDTAPDDVAAKPYLNNIEQC